MRDHKLDRSILSSTVPHSRAGRVTGRGTSDRQNARWSVFSCRRHRQPLSLLYDRCLARLGPGAPGLSLSIRLPTW